MCIRDSDDIKELAGCDLLTISPKLLGELQSSIAPLPKKLDSSKPAFVQPKVEIDSDCFDKMMKNDRMASEKLDEGIRKFSEAIKDLELMLGERLSVLEEDKEFALSA